MIKPLIYIIALLTALLNITVPGMCTSARLTVWGMENNADKKGQEVMIAEFARRHPGVDVVTLSMGAGAMNPQKLMTAIAGGVPPDLVMQDRFTIGDWASRGAFLPLDDFLKADELRKDALAIHRSNYVDATWKEAVYAGHVYAIPSNTDDRVLYYNKACFRDAGLDPNKPPRTWDELINCAHKLTIRSTTGYQRIGFIPGLGQGWLYLWAWQLDGEAMSRDGRRCTLNNPETCRALGTLVSWYDVLGGVDAINGFANGFGGNEYDPFMTGKVAMKVDGDGFLDFIARYHPEMDFGVCPVPVPVQRYLHAGPFKNGSTWVTWSGGNSYAVPVGSAHPKLAWEFIEWMNSPEANLIGAAVQYRYMKSKSRIYIPGLFADNRVTKALFDAYAPTLPPNFMRAKQTFISLLPDTRFRPVTFAGQRLWDEQVKAVDQALRHEKTPAAALGEAQKRVQIELDSVYLRDRHPLIPTNKVAGICLIALLSLALCAFYFVSKWARQAGRIARTEARTGFVFILPWAIGFFVFTFGPMVSSILLSFCDYDVLHPARFAGMENYRDLVTLDRAYLVKSITNAVYLAVIGIPLGMMVSLAMAMLLNTRVRGMRIYRTCFYIPSIVPVVATAVLWGYLFNPDPGRGLINAAWYATLTSWFHLPPPGWLSSPTWAKPAVIIIGLWGAGGGIILWLAGLKSIPESLYEAARIDGAGSLAQFRHITLPMLSPYIFFNTIMGIIGALQTFETTYILGGTGQGQTTGPNDSLLVPVVYLFNNAFQYFKMGYASALAWLLFVIILGLTLGQLKLAPRWVHYETEQQ